MRPFLFSVAVSLIAFGCPGSGGGDSSDPGDSKIDALEDLAYDGQEPEDDVTEADVAEDVVWTDMGPDTEPCAGTITPTGFRDNCDGTVTDTRTGLMWARTAVGATSRKDGMVNCNALTIGGYNDWRLATIDDLRGILLGCAKTSASGTCGVTNACWQETTCWTDAACGSCDNKGGPGDQGCYTDRLFDDHCHMVLSSTKVDPKTADDRSWYVQFWDGRIDRLASPTIPITGQAFGRCLRVP